jgi:hypothetical protein
MSKQLLVRVAARFPEITPIGGKFADEMTSVVDSKLSSGEDLQVRIIKNNGIFIPQLDQYRSRGRKRICKV